MRSQQQEQDDTVVSLLEGSTLVELDTLPYIQSYHGLGGDCGHINILSYTNARQAGKIAATRNKGHCSLHQCHKGWSYLAQ